MESLFIEVMVIVLPAGKHLHFEVHYIFSLWREMGPWSYPHWTLVHPALSAPDIGSLSRGKGNLTGTQEARPGAAHDPGADDAMRLNRLTASSSSTSSQSA